MAVGERAWIVSKDTLREVYLAAERKGDLSAATLARLGPLAPIFRTFVERNRDIRPPSAAELIERFDNCARDPDPGAVLATLKALAPGGKMVGYREVNLLADHYAKIVDDFLRAHGAAASDLLAHQSAFGSGGDFYKTRHATTEAAIVVSPVLRICKTGTRNVTSEHGSVHAISAHRYRRRPLEGHGPEYVAPLNDDLASANFAFASLAELGLPYSSAMLQARRELWRGWMHSLALNPDEPSESWHLALANIDIPVDIFKVVGANAQPLRPSHHSTGVCHRALIPYVLGIYLDRGTTGIIVHGYDGIDEFSVASSDRTPGSPTSLVIHVRTDSIVIAELAPEDLGLRRARLREIVQQRTSRREARVFRRILEDGDHSAHRDLVVANAALLLVAGEYTRYDGDGLGEALRRATGQAGGFLADGSALRNYLRVFTPTRRQRFCRRLGLARYRTIGPRSPLGPHSLPQG